MSAFPDGFLWGAATSAHQTEGGNVGSDWWTLEHRTPPLFPESSGDACDSWHRWPDDLDLVAEAGLTSYRFSIEWARIEPAPGEISAAALAHYQAMIDGCRERGLVPVVTLHHFTNPHWLRREAGGWRDARTVDRFRSFADVALSTLRDVDLICTLNEPNMTATWATGFTSEGEPAPDPVVTEHLLAAHRHASDLARAQGRRAGLTLAMTAYDCDDSPEARARLAHHRALDEDVFIEAAAADSFLGVQVYTRRVVTAEAILPMGQLRDGPAPRRTQMGWTFAPDALGDCVRYAHALVPGVPLLVTENGIATADDGERVEYTEIALHALVGALADGVPVEGYWHWSLLDNFEWASGFAPTFGLIGVDRDTFARRPKPSLTWLGSVATRNALPRDGVA